MVGGEVTGSGAADGYDFWHNVTGSVNQELLLRNEYLAADNRILRTKLPPALRLSDPERITLAEIGKRLGCKTLRKVACVAKPDTILAWYRKLVARKFDGSKHPQYPGCPSVSSEVEALVVRTARESSGWGYGRIVGALANIAHRLPYRTYQTPLLATGSLEAINLIQGCISWCESGGHLDHVLPRSDFRRPGGLQRGRHPICDQDGRQRG